MLYLAWDRKINILLFFATFLYDSETPGLEQGAVVTMATRVLRPLKIAFLCILPECLTACKIWRGVEIFHFPRCLILSETCSSWEINHGILRLAEYYFIFEKIDNNRFCQNAAFEAQNSGKCRRVASQIEKTWTDKK